jgi:hypothetical protein
MVTERRDDSTITVRSYSEWLANKTSRRGFLGTLGKVFAWTVGVEWVSDPLLAWNPFGSGSEPGSLGLVFAQVVPSVPGSPWPKPPTGPAHDPGLGKGDGCVREDQQGEFGCDCMCMYGANECPRGDAAPGGTFWCACINIGDGPAKTMRWLCYADCFSADPKNDHNLDTDCVNSTGRNCFCDGVAVGPFNATWPRRDTFDGMGGRPPASYVYDCTRVIDMTPTLPMPPPTAWPEYFFSSATDIFPGTPVTTHYVLRTVEAHSGIPDIVLP